MTDTTIDTMTDTMTDTTKSPEFGLGKCKCCGKEYARRCSLKRFNMCHDEAQDEYLRCENCCNGRQLCSCCRVAYINAYESWEDSDKLIPKCSECENFTKAIYSSASSQSDMFSKKLEVTATYEEYDEPPLGCDSPRDCYPDFEDDDFEEKDDKDDKPEKTKSYGLPLITKLPNGCKIMKEICDGGYLDGQIITIWPDNKDASSTRLAAYYSHDYKLVVQLKIKVKVDITSFF